MCVHGCVWGGGWGIAPVNPALFMPPTCRSSTFHVWSCPHPLTKKKKNVPKLFQRILKVHAHKHKHTHTHPHPHIYTHTQTHTYTQSAGEVEGKSPNSSEKQKGLIPHNGRLYSYRCGFILSSERRHTSCPTRH